MMRVWLRMVSSTSPGHVRAVVTFHWLVVSVRWHLLVANDLTKFSEHFLMRVAELLISQSSVKQQYLHTLSTKFSFLHRIDTNLPTPAPTGSKRADARFPDPLLIPSRLDRDCNLERGSNNWPPTIGRWGGLRWIQWNQSLFRTPSHRPETYINHEFFRAGRQAGRTGTVEEVPQRAAATTLTPFMQLWTPRNFINSNATYPFGADVTNYASLPTKPT